MDIGDDGVVSGGGALGPVAWLGRLAALRRKIEGEPETLRSVGAEGEPVVATQAERLEVVDAAVAKLRAQMP